ncbi:hsp70-like protein [Achlya hypogyna]|uniref:Hsp70-like protein n=1 Tax=Achlya hypogyna TaxID=1202772 RepID=A0A1V9Z194_ACHHY|nr:hsp70-like protein [Achlya hypogyna]
MATTYESWSTGDGEFRDGTVCIGIDLGTTNSCVGYWKLHANHVKVVNHARGDAKAKTLPSVVSFPATGAPVVGFEAVDLEQRGGGDTVTVRCAKRLMGKSHQEASPDQRYLAYTLVGDAHVAVDLPARRTQVTPSEVSALVLQQLKGAAETKLGESIRNCVLTVPAYFNETQRQATLEAATMAGFKAVRLLNEPTAAAMAYGLFVAGAKRVVVFDFGGGTLDVSVLHIDNGTFQVEGVGGDTHLGGEDINHLLMDHVLQSVQRKHGSLPQPLPTAAMVQLQGAVEAAKVALSTADETTIVLKNIAHVASHELTLTRRKLEAICDPLFKKCIRITRDVLKSIDVDPMDVDEVVMVGGSTRIPAIRSRLSAFFNGKELCTSVNADEVVAEGAAIQAAILSGVDKKVFQDVLMLDVIPMSIGIEKADGTMEVLIPKNSRIPVSMTKYFDTAEDGQRGFTIEVFEGEEPVARDNTYLTFFDFVLPRARIGKAGEHQHPVTISMNQNGLLQVKAGILHDSAVDDEDDSASRQSFVVLCTYVVFLMLVYVFVRIYFADQRLWYTDEYPTPPTGSEEL